MLEELTVTASSVQRVKKTPFNAVAVDAKEWANSTMNLSDALKKLPGVKLRESGQLIAHSCAIKILYKTVFLNKSSWKVESAQLENFYFSTGKLFFLSWKIKISQ